MNWKSIGIWAALALLLALPAYAGERQSTPAYFTEGLTDQSSWDEILKKRGIRADFPQLGFGTMYVSLRSLCRDGEMLAIADRTVDKGVRVSPDRLGGREPASAAAGVSSGARVVASGRPGSDAGSPPLAPGQVNPPLAYSVNVYRVIETSLSPTLVFLFQKAWEVPSCQGR